MNNLLQIRDKIKRANRLYEAQLLATKSGEVTPYRRSVLEERIRNTKRNEIERRKKLNSFETDQLRGGFIPLFFYFYKNNVIINLFFRLSIIKKNIILMLLLLI